MTHFDIINLKISLWTVYLVLYLLTSAFILDTTCAKVYSEEKFEIPIPFEKYEDINIDPSSIVFRQRFVISYNRTLEKISLMLDAAGVVSLIVNNTHTHIYIYKY